MSLRIAVCNGQVPFEYGGAEILADALVEQLRKRGHNVDLVQLPQRWYPKEQILKNYLMWRLVNLDKTQDEEPIDRVIALKVPAYAVSHEYKTTWLVHQFRQVYDLFGTEYSWFGNSEEDHELRSVIRRMDTITISESRRIFSISQNVANRLCRFNQVDSEVLYPPPAMDGRFHNEGYGDYVLSISRLNLLKRADLLIKAMGQVKTPVRCQIAGRGPELENLKKLAHQVGSADRIEFLGYVSAEDVLALYAGTLGVYYAPMDEDYGLATLEAMKSEKPVLTASDSGGVLEFVQDRITGMVFPPDDSASLARHIDELYLDRHLAERMGTRASELVAGINWDVTIERLLET